MSGDINQDKAKNDEVGFNFLMMEISNGSL